MIHVRTSDDSSSRAVEPAALVGEARPSLEVALDARGPFEPLVHALERGKVRDAFAALPLPSLKNLARLRLAVLAASGVAFVMALELDRELVAGSVAREGRLVFDALLAAWVVFELTRKTPRLPAVTAVVLVAQSLRWVLYATRLCGRGVHPGVYAAAVVTAVAGAVVATRMPSASRIALEILDRLGISRSEALRAAPPEPPPTLAALVTAVLVAGGVPALAHALRGAELTRAVTLVGFALLAPEIATRLTGRRSPRPHPLPTMLVGLGGGLALAAALSIGSRSFFDAGTELARCTNKLDAEGRRLVEREARELARAVDVVRSSGMRAAITVAVVPLVEERVYRGVLQDVLARKYGTSYGIFATSLFFGLAHVGGYEVALYQTVLLGIAFGVAYAEGGLLAAIGAHAVYNLVTLL